jgi:hypothetical protein
MVGELGRNSYNYPSPLARILRGVRGINLNSLGILFRKGPTAAVSFLVNSHRLYAGYGMPRAWDSLPWRESLRLPKRSIEEIFPEIDFGCSPELLFPLTRDLGINTEELTILSRIVQALQPKRVVEFGTAEGRTAINLALQLPAGSEIVTLDLAPIPGQNDVGYFYWKHPAREKIRQFFCSVTEWDYRPFANSAEVVFVDACDLMPGLGAEFFQAIAVVKQGGVIFRHDYGSSVGATLFWNWVGERLPVFHVTGTTLVCLRLTSDDAFAKAKSLLSNKLLLETVKIPSS